MCADRDLEPRAAKAELSRISHRDLHVDETKKKNNVLFGEDVCFRLGVEGFRTSSSSSCGAARPSDVSTASSSGEATIHLLLALA